MRLSLTIVIATVATFAASHPMGSAFADGLTRPRLLFDKRQNMPTDAPPNAGESAPRAPSSPPQRPPEENRPNNGESRGDGPNSDPRSGPRPEFGPHPEPGPHPEHGPNSDSRSEPHPVAGPVNNAPVDNRPNPEPSTGPQPGQQQTNQQPPPSPIPPQGPKQEDQQQKLPGVDQNGSLQMENHRDEKQGPNNGSNNGPNNGSNNGPNSGSNNGPNNGSNNGPNNSSNNGPNNGPMPSSNNGENNRNGPPADDRRGPEPNQDDRHTHEHFQRVDHPGGNPNNIEVLSHDIVNDNQNGVHSNVLQHVTVSGNNVNGKVTGKVVEGGTGAFANGKGNVIMTGSNWKQSGPHNGGGNMDRKAFDAIKNTLPGSQFVPRFSSFNSMGFVFH